MTYGMFLVFLFIGCLTVVRACDPSTEAGKKYLEAGKTACYNTKKNNTQFLQCLHSNYSLYQQYDFGKAFNACKKTGETLCGNINNGTRNCGFVNCVYNNVKNQKDKNGNYFNPDEQLMLFVKHVNDCTKPVQGRSDW